MKHTCQGTLRQEWSWLVCTRAHSAPPPAIRSQQNSNHPKSSCIWKFNEAALDEGLFEQANVLAETRSCKSQHLGRCLDSMSASSLSLTAPEGPASLSFSSFSLSNESLSLLCASLLPSSMLLPAHIHRQ